MMLSYTWLIDRSSFSVVFGFLFLYFFSWKQVTGIYSSMKTFTIPQ